MKNKFSFKNVVKDIKLFFKHPVLNFDRSFAGGIRQQIYWLLLAFALIFVVLLVVFHFMLPGEGSLSEHFFILLFQLICPESTEDMPDVFAVVVDVVGLIIFSGMLIAVASNILERRVEAYQN